MNQADPNKLDAKFVHYVIGVDDTETNVVYLSDDADTGIGWRLRRVRQVKIGDEYVADSEDVPINAIRAYQILRGSLCAQIMKETLQVTQEQIEEHPNDVAELLQGINGLTEFSGVDLR